MSLASMSHYIDHEGHETKQRKTVTENKIYNQCEFGNSVPEWLC